MVHKGERDSKISKKTDHVIYGRPFMWMWSYRSSPRLMEDESLINRITIWFVGTVLFWQPSLKFDPVIEYHRAHKAQKSISDQIKILNIFSSF